MTRVPSTSHGSTAVNAPAFVSADLWARATLFGVDVWLGMTLVRDEHERRHAAELGPLLDRELLRLALSLPADAPIPLSCLSPRDRRLLRRAPHGAVDRARRSVTWLAVPPVVGTVAVVDAVPSQGHDDHTVRAAIRAASLFAPFCARLVRILDSGITSGLSTEASPLSITEAETFGVGLMSADLTELVAPEPYVVHRFTHASWLFRERCYDAALPELPTASG